MSTMALYRHVTSKDELVTRCEDVELWSRADRCSVVEHRDAVASPAPSVPTRPGATGPTAEPTP
ncbi:hypothetical protein [Streptomyces sp. NPDC048496]|uniref:hypothetical protein n=1 Tax=Streptomyces sp. NPDC048496 TaxID=3365558 RepID=UPI0037147B8B